MAGWGWVLITDHTQSTVFEAVQLRSKLTISGQHNCLHARHQLTRSHCAVTCPAVLCPAVQHPPVYTMGAGSSEAHVKFDLQQPPHPLYRTERGGEVTFHGPGQVGGLLVSDQFHYLAASFAMSFLSTGHR